MTSSSRFSRITAILDRECPYRVPKKAIRRALMSFPNHGWEPRIERFIAVALALPYRLNG